MTLTSPRQKTIKRLFVVSGNQCYFPNCKNPLVDKGSGKVMGKICHIKGRKPGAARYDADQTAEERHGFDNLVLMCSIHHDVIDDDLDSYTVSRLNEIKANHEEVNAGGEKPSEELINQFILNLTHGSIIYSKDQKGGQTAHSIFNIEYSIDLKSTQLFFNKFCTLIQKIYQNKISYIESSKILMDLQQSAEKKFFGIMIIHNQDKKFYNLEILETRYSLKVQSNNSKIDIILKKNKKPLDFDNFANISKLILKLKEYALMQFGLEVKIPNRIPVVKIKANSRVEYIGNMKISSSKSLIIEIYNKNKFPIEIISSGFKANNIFFKNTKHRVLRLGQNCSKEIAIFLVYINITLRKNYKKPYIIQGFIKLNSGEYFLTKKIKIPK